MKYIVEINDREIEVDIDNSLTDDDEIRNAICEAVEKEIISNNETIINVFFDELKYHKESDKSAFEPKESIEVPIYYYITDKGKKKYDREEMLSFFLKKLEQLEE